MVNLMKAFLSALLIALVLTIGGPAAAQDELPACEEALESITGGAGAFFRSADDRIDDLSEIINAGFEADTLQDTAFDLMQWATLADLALEINYADIEVPECSPAQALMTVYKDIIDGAFRIGVHIHVGIEMNNKDVGDRIALIIEERVRTLVINVGLWDAFYEGAS